MLCPRGNAEVCTTVSSQIACYTVLTLAMLVFVSAEVGLTEISLCLVVD